MTRHLCSNRRSGPLPTGRLPSCTNCTNSSCSDRLRSARRQTDPAPCFDLGAFEAPQDIGFYPSFHATWLHQQDDHPHFGHRLIFALSSIPQASSCSQPAALITHFKLQVPSILEHPVSGMFNYMSEIATVIIHHKSLP